MPPGSATRSRIPIPARFPYRGHIVNLATLQVLLNGSAIDSSLIKYAGLTPLSIGLYQINFLLPGTVAPDPEIRIAVAGQTSVTGIKLAVAAAPFGKCVDSGNFPGRGHVEQVG